MERNSGDDFASSPDKQQEEENVAEKPEGKDQTKKGERRLLESEQEKKIRLANLETKFRDDVAYYKEKINLGRNCTLSEKS